MPITQPPSATHLGLLKGFMGIFLPLCLVLLIVGSMHYYTVYTTERSAREASESLNVDLARRMVVSDIASIAGDLMFLAEHIRELGLLDAISAEDRERIIDDFTRAAANITDHIEMLNHDGYWLSNLQEENEWGFMFGIEARFQKHSPYAWGLITKKEHGQFLTKDGLFTFTTIYPLKVALATANSKPRPSTQHSGSHGYWKIVSRISSQQLSATLPFFIQNHLALEQIQYMGDILSDMLTYSRPAALKPDWINIDKVIDMAASISQRRLDEGNVQLNIKYNSGLPTLFGDANKLRQVFSNLISNAAQATKGIENPQVDIDVMVELGSEGTAIRVEIKDNGSGLKPEEQDKLFEPFFTPRATGTGLGLAIVKHILDQHLAGISLENAQPLGTCAFVTLPIKPRPLERPERQVKEKVSS